MGWKLLLKRPGMEKFSNNVVTVWARLGEVAGNRRKPNNTTRMGRNLGFSSTTLSIAVRKSAPTNLSASPLFQSKQTRLSTNSPDIDTKKFIYNKYTSRWGLVLSQLLSSSSISSVFLFIVILLIRIEKILCVF